MTLAEVARLCANIRREIAMSGDMPTANKELAKIIASVADDCEAFGITSFAEWQARTREMVLSQYQCPTCGTRG